MRYFNGFGCQNESELFSFWLDNSMFNVSGFSMGAIDAVEYCLHTNKRVDKLFLFSPAYFCNISDDVKKREISVFDCEPELWFRLFYSKAKIDKRYQDKQNATRQNLEKLLYYQWKKETIQKLIDKKIKIDIFFGSKDNIIDIASAIIFFKPLVRQVTIFKDAPHTLISYK